MRSLSTLQDDDHPHTGITNFRGSTPIPSAALSTHAANVLSAALRQNRQLRVRLELSAQILPDVTSYNVIGEIIGSETPGEIVLVGAHLDSWDLGQGAHDDGTGIVQSIEVLRAVKASGLRPKRTLRAVAFKSEEFGGVGAEEYARLAAVNQENHLVAIESDRGGFAPDRITVQGDAAQVQALQSWLPYFQFSSDTRSLRTFELGSAGTDVEPLAALGTLTFDFAPVSTRYFEYHHSGLDRLEAVNRDELEDSALAMATFIYLFSEQGRESVP